jgi:hypothetical protein
MLKSNLTVGSPRGELQPGQGADGAGVRIG